MLQINFNTIAGYFFLGIVVCFVLAVLYFFLFFLPAAIKEKNKYNYWPGLKEFEQYTESLLTKIEKESSWHFLRPILADIDNIPAKYKGTVPEHTLKSTLILLRNKHQERRNQLAPKAT